MLKNQLSSSLVGLCVLGFGAASCANSPPARFDDTTGGTGGALMLAGTGTGTGTGVGGTFGSGVGGNVSGEKDAGRATRYDDAGMPSCINIGSYGKPGTFGAGMDDTRAFETWLNSKSSATASMVLTHTKLTAEFLAGFDVFILQDLEDGSKGTGPFWQFAPEEVDALTKWVQAGGGLIALTGYSGSTQEVVPTNQLLKFSNISFNTDDNLSACPDAVTFGANCWCVGGSVPVKGWVATDPISQHITQVGAFHGRTITAPDATLVAGEGASKYAVSKSVGSGKVFVFGDEWVTYTSQWGTPLAQNADMNNMCYMHGAIQLYQVPQFWYNAIKWVAPNNTCFMINDPAVIN